MVSVAKLVGVAMEWARCGDGLVWFTAVNDIHQIGLDPTGNNSFAGRLGEQSLKPDVVKPLAYQTRVEQKFFHQLALIIAEMWKPGQLDTILSLKLGSPGRVVENRTGSLDDLAVAFLEGGDEIFELKVATSRRTAAVPPV